MGGPVFVESSEESRVKQEVLERSVYTVIQGLAPRGFTVENIIGFIGWHTISVAGEFRYLFAGHNMYLITFLERFRRNLFLQEHETGNFDDCICKFEAWEPRNDAELVRYVKKVWLRVMNIPEHHHTKKSAESLVSHFGRLSAIDLEKTKVDFSKFDIMVDCHDVVDIPRHMGFIFDGLYRRQVVNSVILEMDILRYDALSYNGCGLSYGEIFDLAREGRRAKRLCLSGMSLN